MPPPIILDIAGLVQILTSAGESETPLSGTQWQPETISTWSGELLPGMTTFLYTDGLLAAKDAFGERFGIKRFLAHCLLAAEQDAEELSTSLGAALDRHTHAQARIDATHGLPAATNGR